MADREFSEQAFFVLTALADGPLHGYAILRRAGELSGGRVHMAVGTLYGIVDRLATQQWIELDREEIVASRLRRYYRLTDDGRRALRAEASRQAANARIALSRLGGAQTAMTIRPQVAAGAG